MNTKLQIGLNDKKEPFYYDLKYMPHLLIAGNTGSGKSQFIHNLILQLMDQNTQDEVKFIMSDCNRVELVSYTNIPYLYAPVQTESEIGKDLFEWLDYEQNRRYEEFIKHRVRGIDDLNNKMGKVVLPKIIVIVDELANISVKDPEAVEKGIVRVSQLAKASGIHMILATQCASKDIVTGLIKANIPSRLGFRTNTVEHSKWIIDQAGAEKLNGKGDMLFVPPDRATAIHLQGTYVSDKEISDRVERIKVDEPEYNDVLMYALRKQKEIISEELIDKAKKIVIQEQKASASLIQRELSIGYSKAARILDKLEEIGVISPYDKETNTRKVHT